jgi:hypothetical protein
MAAWSLVEPMPPTSTRMRARGRAPTIGRGAPPCSTQAMAIASATRRSWVSGASSTA